MRTHVAARSEKAREARAVVDVALACASPLCEVLCKDASEVCVEEYRRCCEVLVLLSGMDPARVGGECTRPDQCTIWSAWSASGSALGVLLAKDPATLTIEDVLTVGCIVAPLWVQFGPLSSGIDAIIEVAGITTLEFLGMLLPAAFLNTIATPADERNLIIGPLLVELMRAPAEQVPDFAMRELNVPLALDTRCHVNLYCVMTF
jgi:hypothetical protein